MTSTFSETSLVVRELLEDVEMAESVSERAGAALQFHESRRGSLYCDLLEQLK